MYMRLHSMPGKASGFTMIEVVVMLSIITIISTVVLVSFTGLSESGAVNRSVRELALALRRAQNMSLAVAQVETSSGSRIPPAVGVRLDLTNPSAYFVFADLLFDKKYTADDAKIGSNENFPPGIRLSSLTGPSGTSYALIHVIFAAPEAVTTLTDVDGASIGDRVDIEITSPSGQKKKVVVRTSGQVSIK